MRQPAHKRKKQNKLSMILVTTVVCVLMGVVIIRGAEIQKKIDANNQQIALLQEKIDAENKRTEEIEEFSKEVQTKGYVEEVAREKLNLTYENEITFKEGN